MYSNLEEQIGRMAYLMSQMEDTIMKLNAENSRLEQNLETALRINATLEDKIQIFEALVGEIKK